MKKGEGKLVSDLTLSQKKVKSFLEAKYRKKKSKSTVNKYRYSLAHFQTFLLEKYPKEKYTLEQILPLLSNKKIPVYTLLNDFVKYLEDSGISAKSIVDYMTGVRSFLLFESEYEIDISRFKDRVSLPSPDTEHEKAIDATTIRKILNSCNNRRLKAFLYVLATSGLRSMEAISLRLRDVELSDIEEEPSIIHVRKEYSKSRRARTIFITHEATKFLRQWIDYKYSEKPKHVVENGKRSIINYQLQRNENHIIFSLMGNSDLESIYIKLRQGFNKILETLDLDERKEGMLRREITFHSFRRFVKTTISDQVGNDFAEHILGHKKDMGYYTKTLEGSIQNYKEVMPQLTFLDVEQIEVTGKNLQKQIDQKDKEFRMLREENDRIKEEQEKMRRIIIEMQKDRLEEEDADLLDLEVDSKVSKKLGPEIMKKVGAAERHARRETQGYYDQPIFEFFLSPDDPKYEEKNRKREELMKDAKEWRKREIQAIYEKTFLPKYRKGYYQNMTEKEALLLEFTCKECKHFSLMNEHYDSCSKYDGDDVKEHESYYPEVIDKWLNKRKRNNK